MVAGHLQEKNGYYYVVLTYIDEVTGKRKQPWIPTGLPIKGNKKRAEAFLMEKLFEAVANHRFSLLIQMAAFYGLRKSELLGLKWSAFDFENNTILLNAN